MSMHPASRRAGAGQAAGLHKGQGHYKFSARFRSENRTIIFLSSLTLIMESWNFCISVFGLIVVIVENAMLAPSTSPCFCLDLWIVAKRVQVMGPVCCEVGNRVSGRKDGPCLPRQRFRLISQAFKRHRCPVISSHPSIYTLHPGGR